MPRLSLAETRPTLIPIDANSRNSNTQSQSQSPEFRLNPGPAITQRGLESGTNEHTPNSRLLPFVPSDCLRDARELLSIRFRHNPEHPLDLEQVGRDLGGGIMWDNCSILPPF